MNNLAVLLAARGPERRSRGGLFRASLAMFRRVYGDDHWRVGAVQGGLAGVLEHQRRPERRAVVQEPPSRIWSESCPPVHPSLEPVLLGLARHLMAHGGPRGAEPLIRRVLTTRARAQLGDRNPRTAEAQVWLGACLVRLNRAPEGVPLLDCGARTAAKRAAFQIGCARGVAPPGGAREAGRLSVA